jgi:hypothetical protein
MLGLVHPELGGGCEHPAQPQRRIGRHWLLASDEPLDTGAVAQMHRSGQCAGGRSIN